jgi:YVTN family beta-propeller protein
MTATIPASDIANVGSAQVTVTNPGSGGGTSAARTFTITAPPAPTVWVRTVKGVTAPDNTVPAAAENIVWDAAHGKLYFSNAYTASAPSNTVAVIDPIAGTVVASIPAGNDPDLLSISSDSSCLWVGLDGDHAVQRFLLPGLSKDISFPVPTDSSGNPQQAVCLEAAPVSAHTLGLIAGTWNQEPAGNGIYVYDDATPRPVSFSGIVPNGPTLEWMQWGANDSTLYGTQYTFDVGGIATLNVNSSGVAFASFNGYQLADLGMSPTQYESVNGLLYASTYAFNPVNGTQVGWFNPAPAPFAAVGGAGVCSPDASLGRYYCVLETGYPVAYEL